MNMKRSRIGPLALTFAAMAAGLASRKTADMLPDIVNVYLGDALWADDFLRRRLSVQKREDGFRGADRAGVLFFDRMQPAVSRSMD